MSVINFLIDKKALVALAIFLVVAFGSLWQVERRIRADEWIWVPLGVKFVDSIKQGDFEASRVSTRPGVTVSWISGITTSVAEQRNDIEVIRLGPDKKSPYPAYVSPKGFVANRVVFSLLTAVSIALIFLAMTKLLEWKQAAIISTLIGLHPLTLLKGDVVWTDLYLAIFMLLSIITFSLYWKNSKVFFLAISGILFGLSIATKTAGIILLPVFFITTLLDSFDKKTIKRAFVSTFSLAVIGFATFFLIYPYLWVKIFGFFDRYKGFLIETAAETEVAGSFSLLYYPEVLFKVDPVLTVTTALLSIPILIQLIRRKPLPLILILTVVATVIYLTVLIWVSQFGYLNGRRIANARYIVPAVYFMAVFLIVAVDYFAKKGLKSLWLVPIAMFLINLYNFFDLLKYDINEY